MKIRTLAFAGALTFAASALHAQTYPSQGETPVTDDAELIDAVEEAKLAERIVAIEQESGADIAVVTLPATQHYTMGDDLDVYARGLMENWELGATTEGKAVLLLVFRDDRELRLEVTGLGEDASEAAQGVIDGAIVPRFREDDFGGGISLGVEGIADDILKVGAAAAPADTADTSVGAGEASTEGGGNILIWIGGIFAAIIAFFVAMGRRARAKLAATPCSACGKTGLTRERVTVEEATTERAGKGEIRTICPHCGHVEVETYSISKLAKSKPAEKEKPKSSGGASGEW